MIIKRILQRELQKSKKSILLLGPRQAGKSTLIQCLSPELTFNLSDEEVFVNFLRDPGLLRRRIGKSKSIFIDEVQRIPSLLNTVQALIDEDKSRMFFLTGSSARKLRRGKANLLPGRILVYHLGPFSPEEIGSRFNFDQAISLGLLPEAVLSESSVEIQKLLRSYAMTYLKEEIQAEALTRNLEGFSRFFEVVAAHAGQFMDFTKFSSQAAIERTSARRYFEILQDTLILENIGTFNRSAKRKLIQHPKYYFFDVGVMNGALGNFTVSADRKGVLFETLFLQCALSGFRSKDQDVRVTHYRTEAGSEVDFIFEFKGQTVAIEVKATRNIGVRDLTGLRSFNKYYGKSCKCLVVYLGDSIQDFGDIQVYPFLDALKEL